MTPERFDGIEQRTRKVEEAVIKFGQIADIVVIEHGQRLKDLEVDVDAVKSSIYKTCDAKTKEIDDKIAKSFDVASQNVENLFKQSVGISIGMFGLFVGALAYFNLEHGHIYERMNAIQSESVAHKTNIDNIMATMSKIDDKLDDIHKNFRK